MRSRPISSLVFALVLLSACKSQRALRPEDVAAAAVSAEIKSAAAKEVERRRKWSMPSGPILPVEAGAGLGAIRIGATAATVERLMDKACEVRTEELCRYISRGVDFHLEGGITQWIHVQRAGRPAGLDFKGEPVEFGFFNGAIPPDLRLGMVPKAIQQYLGPPERIERVPEPNPATIVARDYYPGLVIEYDRYSNGKFIMGGIRIVKDPLGRAGYQYVPPEAREQPSAAPAPSSRPRQRQVVR